MPDQVRHDDQRTFYRFIKFEGELNLLITDVVMPEMNGRELSERLQHRYPELKTLFMSGYTADVIAPRYNCC